MPVVYGVPDLVDQHFIGITSIRQPSQIIMPGTDAIGATKIAMDILRAIRDLNLPHAKSDFRKVTLSVGVATLEPWSQLPEVDANCEALVCAADKALYAAKLAGRNTICCDSFLAKRPEAWLDHAP